MSKKWQYGTYTQDERYDMIRRGNADVYNSEKERNASMKSHLSALGLSTDSLDRWDKAVDVAYKLSSRTYPTQNKSASPIKFMSKTESDIRNGYSKKMSDISKRIDAQAYEAVSEAQSDYTDLEEWLANNGYSQSGSLSRKQKEKISDTLTTILTDLQKEYDYEEAEAKKKLSSALSEYRRYIRNKRASKIRPD